MVRKIEYENRVYTVDMFQPSIHRKHRVDRFGDSSFGDQQNVLGVYRNQNDFIESIVFVHHGYNEGKPIQILVDDVSFEINSATGMEFYRIDNDLACIVDCFPI